MKAAGRTTVFAEVAARAISLAMKPSRSGAIHRTGGRIHRSSLEEGSFEDRFWRRYQPRETDHLYKAAENLWAHQRPGGKAWKRSDGQSTLPHLTQSTLRVYRTLCELGRTCKGEIWPSYEWLAKKAHVGRATVARALKQLSEAGLLIIQRRCRRTSNEGPGPRFEQATNAYRLVWPSRFARWLAAAFQPCPLPDDDDCRRRDALAEHKEPTALDRALASLERKLSVQWATNEQQPAFGNKREYQNDAQTLPTEFINRIKHDEST
jgi:DNA-binding transcriptional ArsR family regulator